MDDASHDATGRSYDAVSAEYLARFGDELDHKPLDRALLSALLEQRQAGTTVADVGCGPGHVAAWMAARGAKAIGIDLSAAMVDLGRQTYPGVEFRQGDLLSLPAEDGEFGAAVVLYSIIHLQPGELAPALAEVHRVLRPQGLLLISFHVGTEVRHFDDLWGEPVDLDFRFFQVDEVADALGLAAFEVTARLQRVNYPEEVETTRGYLLARR